MTSAPCATPWPAQAESGQPANLGPIGVVGVYALPFVAIAKLRGKCH